MWKRLTVNQRDHFLATTIKGMTVKCVFHDFSQWWGCNIPFGDVLTRVRALNKRIDYDEKTVRVVLQDHQPETVSLAADGTDVKLKLKYRVDSRPFHFEWSLQPQTSDNVNTELLLPLLNTVARLSQNVQDLQEVIRLKDYELHQYKVEFATLRRSTVMTEPFDFGKFENDNAATKKFVESCSLMVPVLQQHCEAEEVVDEPAEFIKVERPSTARKSITINKRKQEIKRHIEEQRLRMRKGGKQAKLVYLDSQSPYQSQEPQTSGQDEVVPKEEDQTVAVDVLDNFLDSPTVVVEEKDAERAVYKAVTSETVATSTDLQQVGHTQRFSEAATIRTSQGEHVDTSSTAKIKTEDSLLALRREFDEMDAVFATFKKSP